MVFMKHMKKFARHDEQALETKYKHVMDRAHMFVHTHKRP